MLLRGRDLLVGNAPIECSSRSRRQRICPWDATLAQGQMCGITSQWRSSERDLLRFYSKFYSAAKHPQSECLRVVRHCYPSFVQLHPSMPAEMHRLRQTPQPETQLVHDPMGRLHSWIPPMNLHLLS